MSSDLRFVQPIKSNHPPLTRTDGTSLQNDDVWRDTSGLDNWYKYKDGSWIQISYSISNCSIPINEKIKTKNAYNIIKLFDIKPKLNILEIGCGIGFLTKTLRSIGHSVVAVDDHRYLENDSLYINALKKFNIQRYHWFFDTSQDIDQFACLKTYNNNQAFDLIITERNNFHICDNRFIDHSKILLFVNGCKSILKHNGTVILGLQPKFPSDFPVSNGYGYNFLDDAKFIDPLEHLGDITMLWKNSNYV